MTSEMKFTCTTTNRQHAHKEIRFSYDEKLVSDDDARNLVSYFEEAVRSGTKFKSGETLQYGWMVTSIFDVGDGTLEVREPDFESMPIKFVDSMTRTIVHAAIQKYTVESFGWDLETSLVFPSICESAIICDRALQPGDFVMERAVPKGAHSGWFLGCLDQSHDHKDPALLRHISLYEVARSKPAIIDFAAMPPGTLMAWSNNGGLSLYRDGVAAVAKAGSYIALKLKTGSK